MSTPALTERLPRLIKQAEAALANAHSEADLLEVRSLALSIKAAAQRHLDDAYIEEDYGAVASMLRLQAQTCLLEAAALRKSGARSK